MDWLYFSFFYENRQFCWMNALYFRRILEEKVHIDMDDRINGYLDKMQQFENAGFVIEALQLADQLVKTFPDDKAGILLEKAKLEFRNQYYREALFDFIAVHELIKEREVYDLILEAYYLPNKEMLERNFRDNVKHLEAYPHYRNVHGEQQMDSVPIWQDEEILICTNLADRSFYMYKSVKNNIEKDKAANQILMLINELWMKKIIIFEENFRMDIDFMDMDIPMYLVFDADYWILFLQLYDITELMKRNRIVFLIGKESVYSYLQEDQVVLPTCFCANGQKEYDLVLEEVIEIFNQQDEKMRHGIETYYKTNKESIISNIKSGKPKIIFLTSRFTTALQYHTRDCMQAAERLGYETRLLIEQDGIHRVGSRYARKCIAEFRPDIVFAIDVFSVSKGWCPKEVVWITWIQDKLQKSTGNQEVINSLSERDVLISAFISDLNGTQWGMEYKDVLKAPISVNGCLYQNWELSQEEKRKYNCDICIVANESDYKKKIDVFLEEISKDVHKDCRDIISVYIDLMEQEQFFYGFENNFKIINYIALQLGIYYNQNFIRYMSDYIYYLIFYSRYKSLVAEWLIDHGYTNIKLYGSEWGNNEKFRPYAMGVIENGEKLSKALRASKIAIGLHPHVSLPARLIETIASGTFYIAHHIPEEFDLANAREYFKEGEELVYYYNKQDLLDKIHYYLNHENEREKIVKAGQNRIAQDLTYEKILKRVIQETAQLIEKREEKENAHN